jgi:predicted esterase
LNLGAHNGLTPVRAGVYSQGLERTIPVTIHGRYLVVPPQSPAQGLLVGFHGYGENAEIQLERLQAIPESDQWVVVSIQALNRFYERRTDKVVANWMTRQDRELAIAANLDYVEKCLEAVVSEWSPGARAVFAGFSQGVAMAFRATARANRNSRVIAVGGDVPPELDRATLGRIESTLLVRGSADTWYTKEQLSKDEQRLAECGVQVEALDIDAGHEWPHDAETREHLKNVLTV